MSEAWCGELWRKEQNFYNDFTNISLPMGGLSLVDIEELYHLVYLNSYNTQHFVENIKIADVGCYTGMSTVLFSKIAKLSGQGTVHSIDWFKGSENTDLHNAAKWFKLKDIHAANLAQFPFTGNVTVIDKPSVEAAKDFVDEYFNVVFIDADHRYKYAKEDILAWLPKVKRGGLICGHDCEVLIPNGIWDLYERYDDVDMIKQLHLGVSRALFETIPEAKKTTSGVIWYHKKK